MNFGFIKTSYRNLLKDKFLSSVLMLGLVVGMTAFTLVAVYLDFQFSFDNYHKDADKIYRIVAAYQNKSELWEVTLAKYTDAVAAVPGILSSTKIFNNREIKIKCGNTESVIEKTIFADSGFFSVFTYKFIDGTNKQLLANPFEAVITKTYAKKIWGTINVVGKTFNHVDKNYTIKAVIDDIPNNSHFQFDIVLSMSSWPMFTRMNNEFVTYFRLKNEVDAATALAGVNSACQKVYSEYLTRGFGKVEYIFQPLREIHLNSESINSVLAVYGSKSMIRILFVIGFCTGLIMIMNFVNLVTVKFQNRYKEIGIRKVVGADKKNLVYQFLGESLITSVPIAIASSALVLVLIKPFSSFFEINLSDYVVEFYKIVIFLLACGIIIGFLATIIPMFRLFKDGNPLIILSWSNAVKRNRLMNAVVLIQFSIVSGLISILLVTEHQVSFLKNKDLGYNKNQIIYFENNGNVNYSSVLTVLESIPGVLKATGSDSKPGDLHSGMTLNRLGADKSLAFSSLEERIQKNYIATYGLKIIAGRDFTGINEDEKDNIILNETAVKKLGYKPESIINEKVNHTRGIKTVIGVVKDYHLLSLHSKIGPLILSNTSPRVSFYSVLVNSDNYKILFENIKNKIKNVDANFKVEPLFLSDFVNNLYKADQKESRLIFIVTFLCILLSLVGLVALASYTILKRTKEIGIRKVLGASVSNILVILYKDFIKIIIIANIIIIPFAWLFISSWLNNYPFHVSLGMSYFIITFILVSILTIIAILYLASKAAFKNPVDAIRYE